MPLARPTLVATALLLALAACGKKDAPVVDTTATMPAAPSAGAALTVTTIETGRRMGADRRVADTTSTFGVRDTIYAAVVTQGAANGATLVAKWTYQDGQTVDSTSQAIAAATGTDNSAVTEFRLMKASPWPAGTYTLDVMMDGRSVGTRQIRIQ
jgi:hypothetical protein